MPFLLFVGTAAPATRQGLTMLSSASVPGPPYGPFVSRAPTTVVQVDPGSFAWTGLIANAPLVLTIDVGEFRWTGLPLPGSRYTTLSSASVPGARYGPFVPRTTPTIIVVDPADFMWKPEPLVVSQDDLTPGTFAWTGQEVIVRTRPFSTGLGSASVPSLAYGPFVARDGAFADAGGLNWIGGDVRVVEVIRVDPGTFTWLGLELTTPAGGITEDRGLEPLTGVR